MKTFLLVLIATFITIYLIATAESLPDTQSITLTSTHLFNWQTNFSFAFSPLLVINLFCLPVVIFLLKFLVEKKLPKSDQFLFVAGIGGIASALPSAGLVLLGALILFLIVLVTFNSGFADTFKIVKLTLFFYFAALVFFNFSGWGIILTLLISLASGILVATILEGLKKSLAIATIITLVIIMAIIDSPRYHN